MRLKDAIAHAGRVCSAFLICSLRFGDGVVPKGGVLPERRKSTSSSGSDEEDRQNAQQSNLWENRQSAAKDLREHGTSLGSTDDDEPSGSASCAESRLHALTQQLQAYGGCRQAHTDICPDTAAADSARAGPAAPGSMACTARQGIAHTMELRASL